MKTKRRSQARTVLRRKRSRLGSTGTCSPVAKEHPHPFQLTPNPLTDYEKDIIVQAIKLMRENPKLSPEEAVTCIVLDEDLKVILAKRLKILLQKDET